VAVNKAAYATIRQLDDPHDRRWSYGMQGSFTPGSFYGRISSFWAPHPDVTEGYYRTGALFISVLRSDVTHIKETLGLHGIRIIIVIVN